MIFNLNYRVGVKLTEKGLSRYTYKLIGESMALPFHLQEQARRIEIDADGYTWMQGHRLIEIFGGWPHFIGSLMDMNIKLEPDGITDRK